MARHYTPEEKRKVLELLDNGVTIVEVVKRTGIPRPTIYRWVYKYEVDLGSVAKAEPAMSFDREAIREMFEQGASGREVADAFGCSLRYAYAVKNGELE